MKPERITTIPPGCCIEIATAQTGELFFSGMDNFFVLANGEILRHTVLRPSAENKYGVLPWDIPIPANYEPDGEWEPKEGEKAAFRDVKGASYYIDHFTGMIVQGPMNPGNPRLCVRRIKTKHTVVEVELRAYIKPFDVANEITIGRLDDGDRYFGTVTAIREIER